MMPPAQQQSFFKASSSQQQKQQQQQQQQQQRQQQARAAPPQHRAAASSAPGQPNARCPCPNCRRQQRAKEQAAGGKQGGKPAFDISALPPRPLMAVLSKKETKPEAAKPREGFRARLQKARVATTKGLVRAMTRLRHGKKE